MPSRGGSAKPSRFVSEHLQSVARRMRRWRRSWPMRWACRWRAPESLREGHRLERRSTYPACPRRTFTDGFRSPPGSKRSDVRSWRVGREDSCEFRTRGRDELAAGTATLRFAWHGYPESDTARPRTHPLPPPRERASRAAFEFPALERDRRARWARGRGRYCPRGLRSFGPSPIGHCFTGSAAQGCGDLAGPAHHRASARARPVRSLPSDGGCLGVLRHCRFRDDRTLRPFRRRACRGRSC